MRRMAAGANATAVCRRIITTIFVVVVVSQISFLIHWSPSAVAAAATSGVVGLPSPKVAGPLELRVHEGALAGERLTASRALHEQLDALRACVGQLERAPTWVDFDSLLGVFVVVSGGGSGNPIDGGIPTSSAGPTTEPGAVTLHMLCPGSRMHTLSVGVRITRPNRHAPIFERDAYTFYVPTATVPGTELALLKTSDADPIIYNAETRLSVVQPGNQAKPDSGGTATIPVDVRGDEVLILSESLSKRSPFVPIKLALVAVDFGSPQKFARVNLTIVPVTVSQVVEPKMNLATPDYQVIEWRRPLAGQPTKYRVTIWHDEKKVHEEEVPPERTELLTRLEMLADDSSEWRFSVASVDERGETPSDPIRFAAIPATRAQCPGECSSPLAGRPLCRRDIDGRLVQWIEKGHRAHCVCYAGYRGHQCQTIDTCEVERRSESWGGVDWQRTPVNGSATVLCPFNDDGQTARRLCVWRPAEKRARWSEAQAVHCKSQAAVLTHLGMLGTFGERAASATAIATVTRFLDALLGTPSFAAANRSTAAHFDAKVAEHAAQVLDHLLQLDIRRNVSGNATDARLRLLHTTNTMAAHLPAPFSLASPRAGLYMRTIDWKATTTTTEQENGGVNESPVPRQTSVGPNCVLQFGQQSRGEEVASNVRLHHDHLIRATCLRNGSSLFWSDHANSNDPVMLIASDPPLAVAYERLRFALRPAGHLPPRNLTCAGWDEKAKKWSSRGVQRIHQQHHVRGYHDAHGGGGWVVCLASRNGAYALVPEELFASDEMDLNGGRKLVAAVKQLPTMSALLSLVVSTACVFVAATQNYPSLDGAALALFFLLFLFHCLHVVSFVAPLIGEPLHLFAAAPSLLYHLYEFGAISLSSLFLLVSLTLFRRTRLLEERQNGAGRRRKRSKYEDPTTRCCGCGRPAQVMLLAIVLPALLTYGDARLSRSNSPPRQLVNLLDGVNVPFISFFLTPCSALLGIALSLLLATRCRAGQLSRAADFATPPPGAEPLNSDEKIRHRQVPRSLVGASQTGAVWMGALIAILALFPALLNEQLERGGGGGGGDGGVGDEEEAAGDEGTATLRRSKPLLAVAYVAAHLANIVLSALFATDYFRLRHASSSSSSSLGGDASSTSSASSTTAAATTTAVLVVPPGAGGLGSDSGGSIRSSSKMMVVADASGRRFPAPNPRPLGATHLSAVSVSATGAYGTLRSLDAKYAVPVAETALLSPAYRAMSVGNNAGSSWIRTTRDDLDSEEAALHVEHDDQLLLDEERTRSRIRQQQQTVAPYGFFAAATVQNFEEEEDDDDRSPREEPMVSVV